MSESLKWKVIRGHLGDRWYEVGETREGTRAELGHLVPKNLLPVHQDGEKSEEPPLNKAQGAAPANKAATGRARKGT